MRPLLLTFALLATSLAACGGSSGGSTTQGAATFGTSTSATPAQVTSTSSTAATSSGTSTSSSAAAKSPGKAAEAPVAVHARYVAPATTLKTANGKVPAVLLLPDAGKTAAANAEASKLSKLGLGALVVAAPSVAPTQAAAFESAVAQTLAAIKQLRSESGIDPSKVGIVGEGIGAHVGAVAIGRAPTAISAAVLANLGGAVGPSPKYAPEFWLHRAGDVALLFQRDTTAEAMTAAQAKRLIISAPPGTLMEDYKQLGSAAETSRDTWLKQRLLAG